MPTNADAAIITAFKTPLPPIAFTLDTSRLNTFLNPGSLTTPALVLVTRDSSIRHLVVSNGDDLGFLPTPYEDDPGLAMGFTNNSFSTPSAGGTQTLKADLPAPAQGVVVADPKFTIIVGGQRATDPKTGVAFTQGGTAIPIAFQEVLNRGQITSLEQLREKLEGIIQTEVAAMTKYRRTTVTLEIAPDGQSFQLVSHPDPFTPGSTAPLLTVTFQPVERTQVKLSVGVDFTDPDFSPVGLVQGPADQRNFDRLTLKQIQEASSPTDMFVPILTGDAQVRLHLNTDRDKRVDWRVTVKSEGQAVVRVKAITDEDSDAMEMRFPCLVHGMLKTDSYSGYVRPDKDSYGVSLTVPAERRVNESRLEVRYSPTLAGAMVDALPYLVDYPYGCTEQTLNRFLPTVMVQRTLQRMNLNLKDIRDKRTNLNAQEIGDDKERAKGWKRFDRNPVFDEDEVKSMSAAGVLALSGMQLGDGGWGWFSGHGEHSWPHTTAVVVHGLQLAKENDVGLPANMLERGVEWLKNYQAEQIRLIKNAPSKTLPYKEHADETDALVNMVLVDAGAANDDMRDFLYRDRNELAVYAKAMFGLALHKRNEGEKLAMILRNIDQFVVQDDENQTAYLRLPAGNHWWQWYGSETEANGYYLKLLARTSPKDEKASRLVKYLLNNRKNATYWNSTRDTAICVEAMAEYLKASGEATPNMDVEVWLDGKKVKEEHIDAKNLFTFDNKLVPTGDAIETGKHLLEVKRKGTGPVYFNAYLTNFTLEDFITKAGLEVKVNRKYYKLTRADKDEKVQGSSGQVVGQRAEKYVRTELKNLSVVKSGDLVEVELEIDSKNDYEYLIFEDPKAAGFEAMLVRSGYNGNDMGAYVELRDDRVSFFVRALARGKHSVSYRLRAEIPGKFSALPTRGYAMYAPELKGNSDEIKIGIDD